MPYEPYDTGWIQSIYSAICLGWFLLSTGLLPRFTMYSLINNIYNPLSTLTVGLCEFVGSMGLRFGTTIIQYEAVMFKKLNYIDPIYNIIQYIEGYIPSIDGGRPPSSKYAPSNVRLRKTSSGRHVAYYYASKRRKRSKQIIIPSTEYYFRAQFNNKDSTHESRNSTSKSSTINNEYDYEFYPSDDPSYLNDNWYDAISPYWTGGMIWGGRLRPRSRNWPPSCICYN